jgi:uracil DNA glycosylase
MSILSTVNLEEVKTKLYEKLKPSGWGDKLKTFILSDDFDKILQYLLNESKSGKHFTPVLKQVFRAFEECPYNELKVVMIGQD